MSRLPRFSITLAAAWLCAACMSSARAASPSFAEVIRQTQPKLAKIYGAGGYRGLESYQSGFVISPEGHVLTVWSYVLDTDYITVTLHDGRKFDAKLVAADPRLELAVLKVPAEGLAYFELAEAAEADLGTRVLAFSNLYGVATGDEPVSVQHGAVASKTKLDARRGAFETPYRGTAYVLDAMTNNPGAAGGALTDRQGRLLGMLGKELRNSGTNTWLNYAIPAQEMLQTVNDIRSGKFVKRPIDEPQPKPNDALNLDLLGLVLVPDVLERTPPYVDAVRPGSPAAEAGLQPDDLVLFLNEKLVSSCKTMRRELEYIDRVDKVKLILLRDQELVNVTLGAKE